MVTTPEAVEPEPTTADVAEGALRSAIAGHPQGAVRRILLYLLITGVIGVLSGQSPLTIVLGVVGLGALLLLVATDQLA